MMQKELAAIKNRIEKIKRELQTIEIMRPGCILVHYKNPGKKNGAYYQTIYTLDMKSHTGYVQKDPVDDVKKANLGLQEIQKPYGRMDSALH